MAPGCRRHLHGVPRVKRRSAFDTMLTSPCYAPFPKVTALVNNQCQVSREIMWSKALSGSLSEAWFEILIVVGGSGSFRLCLGVLPRFKLAARTHADDCVRSNIFSDRFCLLIQPIPNSSYAYGHQYIPSDCTSPSPQLVLFVNLFGGVLYKIVIKFRFLRMFLQL